MAWDASRPVPYRRLVTEWLIYAAIMVVVFTVLLRDSTNLGGLLIGLVVSLPLWIGFSYVLAKLGYQRKTLRQARTERTAPAATTNEPVPAAARPRPAPTKRTSAGPNRSSSKKR